MNNTRPGETVFIVLLILGLLAFVLGSFANTVELRALPQAFGLGGIALLVLLLVGNRLPSVRRWTEGGLAAGWGKMPAGGDAGPKRKETAGDARVLRIIAYMAAVWVMALVAGLAVTIPLFIAVFLMAEAGVRLRNALAAAIVTDVIVIVGLWAMGIDMWAGIMPEIVPDYVGGAIMPLL